MRILVDLDSVLNDLVPAWLALYNKDYDDNLCEDDLTHWDTSSFVKPKCGKKIYYYLERPELFNNLPTTEYSKEGLYRLSTRHEIYIVSAATRGSMGAKVRWTLKNYPFLTLDNIIFTRRKYLIKGDILIDDAPHNIDEFPGEAIIYSKPWNKDYRDVHPDRFAEGKGKIYIVKNWWDIENLIKRIEEW